MLLQTAVKNNCRIERILNGTRYLKPLMELKHMIGKSYVLLLLKFMTLIYWKDFPGGPVVKNPAANAGDARDSGLEFLDQENPLEKRIAIHSSILAWEIPWTEEPGELQSMVSRKSQTRLATEHTQIHLLET